MLEWKFNEAWRMRRDGWAIFAIAESLGLKEPTVRQLFKDYDPHPALLCSPYYGRPHLHGKAVS